VNCIPETLLMKLQIADNQVDSFLIYHTGCTNTIRSVWSDQRYLRRMCLVPEYGTTRDTKTFRSEAGIYSLSLGESTVSSDLNYYHTMYNVGSLSQW